MRIRILRAVMRSVSRREEKPRKCATAHFVTHPQPVGSVNSALRSRKACLVSCLRHHNVPKLSRSN
uniref:Uncharacterized protein n=1 Tax=Zea mays TaxID=4577 RepID=C4IZT8_MAIZE|nr:unknown [Zea mays]